jgi:putative oxidoreductase
MIPERYAPITYALFRIAFGFLFFCYGLQKMFGWFGGQVAPLASLQGAAGVIETVCGLLVMVGLFTRPASFLASGEMAVAFWYIHVMTIAAGKNLAVPHNLIPINNGGIDAVAFCFVFLSTFLRGPGIWSLDGMMKRPR